MNGQEIRKLRQRLGWSLAEMARQLGSSVEVVANWELDADRPDPDTINQLRQFTFHVETYSEHILQQPTAEKEMEDRGLSQLTNREMMKDGF